MPSITEAQQVLEALGLPVAQQNEMAGLTLLALCGLRPGDPWSQARRESRGVTKGIMNFVATEYERAYAPNTRETFRRQVLHQFVQAGIAEYNPFEPDLPTNSPRAHYAISEPALSAVMAYGTQGWRAAVVAFANIKGSLAEVFARRREQQMVPLTTPSGRRLTLSPGAHNRLQRAVVDEFAPRFCAGGHLLYLGDTAKKLLVLEEASFRSMGVQVNQHDKLPDVVLHDTTRGWLFLVEAVTSHGPMMRPCPSPLTSPLWPAAGWMGWVACGAPRDRPA